MGTIQDLKAENNILRQNIINFNDATKVTSEPLLNLEKENSDLKESLKNVSNQMQDLENETKEEMEQIKNRYKKEKERALLYKRENFTLKNQQANCNICEKTMKN